MADWRAGDVRFLALAQLGERYRRYRLPDPDAEAAMAGSFQRYGQLTPVVVCLREEMHEILDGFKRLAAARALGLKSLSIRLLDADERMAKAAIHGLNQTGRRTQDWEEAWIVHALVREDGMTQVEVAELLGRHKSWVCRRLALVEKLTNEAREDLRWGFHHGRTDAGAVAGRQPGRRPGDIAPRRVDRCRARGSGGSGARRRSQSQEAYILDQPRPALQQARQQEGWAWDADQGSKS